MIKYCIAAGAALITGLTASHAAVMTYTDQTAFEAALSEGHTTIDTSAHVGKTTAQLSALYDGAAFFGAESYVRSDGLIVNGLGFFGAVTPHVGLNFESGVTGVGAWANAFDGGRIQIFSGLNGTGTLLGEAAYGHPGGVMFGGITSTDLILSAIFTCDFNYDLACGLIDPTFGNITLSDTGVSEVPLPAAAWVFLAGLGAIGAARRGKNASSRR